MQKMKKFVFSLCAGVMLTMVACKSGPSSSDPKATLVSFFKALSKKDLKGAKVYATKESESMFSMMEMGMQMAEKMKTKETDDEMKKFDEANIQMGDAKIDGDRATVAVTEKGSGETTDFVLKKEDGAWKVAFDKATMAEMAGKKMQQEGQDVSIDSLNNALQQVNTDSLKAKMEESMKVIDSMSKSMKK
jgi:hypothetical protein